MTHIPALGIMRDNKTGFLSPVLNRDLPFDLWRVDCRCFLVGGRAGRLHNLVSPIPVGVLS